MPSPSLADLIGRLAVIEERVRAAVAARRAVDPEPDDAFRGLYLSDEHADRLLDAGYPRRLRASSNEGMSPADADGARADRLACGTAEVTAEGEELRLPTLARRCGLTSLDVDILLIALAPDLDPRFEKLYGYLHDDVSRRRASPGLALELGGRSPLDAAARARCGPNGALVAAGLLVVEDADRPFLTRSLRVPDRVAAFLLGDDGPEPGLGAVLVDPPDVGGDVVDRLARALTAGVSLTYLRQLPGADALTVAASACRQAGLTVLAAQLGVASTTTTDGSDPPVVVVEAVREARLRGAVLVAGPVDAQSAAAVAGLVTSVHGTSDLVTSQASPQIVLFGRGGWEPETPGPAPLVCDIEPLAAAEQAALWSAELGGSTPACELVAFRLTPRQVRRTVAGARALAATDGCEISIDIRAEHLAAAARAQNATGLERLARRVQPSVTWDDLVLPARTGVALRHLAGRSAHRGTVLDDWGLRRGGGRGEGVTSLFAGESGTGKTMAAEVVAGSLGVDLYVIDLSVVVDKYIGETEKNLERIFVGAEGLNAVLFFDEADALFGKRSEVSDARDRYANVEVAYLLQRMESFDGTAILATNLAANLDEAFRRRLSVVVEFTRPEDAERRELWRRMLRCVPLADDVDLDFCGQAFTLAGGDIRNAVVTAAYLGAANGRLVYMRDLVTAISLEYRKLGRLCLPDEFGPYADLLPGRRDERG